jgi:hypothetical protein
LTHIHEAYQQPWAEVFKQLFLRSKAEADQTRQQALAAFPTAQRAAIVATYQQLMLA